jgi:hypothetical protein
MKLIPIKISSIALVILFFLNGCDKKDDDNSTNQNATRVMVVHASPDAPAVDLYIDNNKVNANALSYPNNSGYLNVTAGNHLVKVTPAGQTTGVLEATLPFTANTNTSIFAYNRMQNAGILVVQDNLATPASGRAHIRFFHLIPGATTVTVGTFNGVTFTPISAFSNRNFETQASSSLNQKFIPIDAGTYNFHITINDPDPSIIDLTNLTLQAGKIYTIFASGLQTGSGNTALRAQVITHN